MKRSLIVTTLVAATFSTTIVQFSNADNNQGMISSNQGMVSGKYHPDLLSRDFPYADRIAETEKFHDIKKNWVRRAGKGLPKKTSYQTKIVTTFDKGEPILKPEPGKLYFYENIDNKKHSGMGRAGANTNRSSQIVVGDATTKEILGAYELPKKLRSAVHTTATSPDGKYVYITGNVKPHENPDWWINNKEKWLNSRLKPGVDELVLGSATLLVTDALTLRPIKQVEIGARLHHASIFQDKYLLMDIFARDPDGLNVFLYDPDTDEIVGGVRSEYLGGAAYTAFTDHEFIYILMEPTGYASNAPSEGFLGAHKLYSGQLMTMRPFWVAKVDPKTWEVVKEYPYPGFRGNWISFSPDNKHMYVTAGGSSNVSKIDIATGEIVWAQATGIGPYGATITADGKELWVADKGETAGMFGRTITVINTETGRHMDVLPSAYSVDHLILSPDGTEIWATSNGEGTVLVYDTATHKRIKTINMPEFGDAHGLTFVYYDENGKSATVRDQNGFTNGVDPYHAKPLILQERISYP